jgi:c-di-GMP-binding flagellar brake protein YcgR
MSDEIRGRVDAEVDLYSETYLHVASTKHSVSFRVDRDDESSAMYQLGVQFARVAEAIEVHMDGTYDDLIEGFKDWLGAT